MPLSWRFSALGDRHRALGSKLEDWSGMGTAWTYDKDIYEEHIAVRTKAGLMDVSGESAQTLALYGCQPGDGSFASNCILARRLAERGSRFIQLYHRDWDHHSLLKEELPLRAKEVDRACMALITDLKQRGMFEDTLIVWSGEFGRTPMKQGDKGPVGRDHHNKAMSMWLAGAGVKGEFENRLKGVIDAVKSSPTPIVMFVDETHTLVGAGGAAGTGDAANLLKPALARGTLRRAGRGRHGHDAGRPIREDGSDEPAARDRRAAEQRRRPASGWPCTVCGGAGIRRNSRG